jgi:UTP--glucose-1-phosphate uridylyltransferase
LLEPHIVFKNIDAIAYFFYYIGMMPWPKWFSEWYDQSRRRAQSVPISNSDITPVAMSDITDYEDLPSPSSSSLCVATVKLNGGLGTTMGCTGPKSLIRMNGHGQTFLDAIIDAHTKTPLSKALVLLNSFHTNDATVQYMNRHYPDTPWYNVYQHAFKRVDADTLTPLNTGTLSDYSPPGHGSVFYDLYYSGTLKKLKDSGISYVFISNSDNVAATVDARIAHYLAQSACPFAIELTSKTPRDVKGGTIIMNQNRKQLWEIGQVSPHQRDLFMKQPLFNTNNIWVSVDYINNAIASNTLAMDLIKNAKIVSGRSVYQLEYAMGSAIQSVESAAIIHVPRSRFFPVKTTGDLLLLLSDVCHWRGHELVVEATELPSIALDAPLNQVDAFFEYMACIPSLKHAVSLQVSGPVHFDVPYTCVGNTVLRTDRPKGISEFTHDV